MENYKNNNRDALQSQNSTAVDDLTRTSTVFEYSFPTNDGGDDTESNKSTPYYTPLEFFQTSFEFPSPKLEKTKEDNSTTSSSATLPAADIGNSENLVYLDSDDSSNKLATPKSYGAVTAKHMQSTSSPVLVNRKLRRFSLYERRSCSPQHLLIKNATSVDSNVGSSGGFIDDKENTKPKFADKKDDTCFHIVSNSGNNSPVAILDETGSPKIFAANEATTMIGSSRLAYSPKLLASINNLNLGSGSAGSPLGVISAGYKNGNYFKFPEIDNVVQDNSLAEAQQEDVQTGHYDNQLRSSRQKNIIARLGNTSPAALPVTQHQKTRFKSVSLDLENSRTPLNIESDHAQSSSIYGKEFKAELLKAGKFDCRKNRKNKNNLTIRITDVPSTQSMAHSQLSPSPKPKTPTIKSTKEKALSLDSAATGEAELTIVVSSRNEAHTSCDEIDAQALKLSSPSQLRQRSVNSSCDRLGVIRNPYVTGNRSTSLSQLSAIADVHNSSSALIKHLSNQRIGEAAQASSNLARTPRRRVPGTSNNDWLQYHRKQNPFNLNAATDSAAKSALEATESGQVAQVVVLKEDDEVQADANDDENLCTKHIQSTSNSSTSILSLSSAAAHRGIHKHNPILLHASNTNLKTLPEFLTLVEFSTTDSGPTTGFSSRDNEYPFRQKSMDLPSSALSTTGAGHHAPVMRTKTIASTSSTNLLQRRGSNHSLTLNLHGSCSNLLGSCRSGLSVSNYSLGSVGNSTTNLNSKSSGNLDLNTPQSVSIIHPNMANSQGAKQSLFRRGSNHSLTLTNLTATSCGNLNSFASQNSLNVDRTTHAGVTRTSSFITQTNNTPSHSGVAKRGLLERRGSNQSLTLNMSSSFGGIGAERNILTSSHLNLGDAPTVDPQVKICLPAATCCSQAHQRKFFSSENLNKANTQFSDLNQAHKRNAKQVCFGSVSDLKPSEYGTAASLDVPDQGAAARRDHFDFQESTVCTCTGVRNIMTRPLSPQTTSEEFKIYLANIQMLQNASNVLNQMDFVKLNYIFDNSYASNSKSIIGGQSLAILNVHSSREAETPPGLLPTSEDSEVAERYLQSVHDVLQTIQPDDNEQKQMFCDLHKEFWDLPLNHQEKPMVFGSQAKNRYKTILPNENSRVLLDRESKELYDDLLLTNVKVEPSSSADISKQLLSVDEVPYINANYIKGPDYASKCYVATQGPLPNTIFEFWLMIYQNTRKHLELSDCTGSPQIKECKMLQQYYQKIVMLTNFLENNRQKCSVYFPVELNEIFIPTCKPGILPPTASMVDFFNAYLQPSEEIPNPMNSYANAAIETFTTSLSDDELRQNLPPTANFFVIKNIGIVRKNGFSIRKLLVLYCVHLAGPDHQLLIHKLYCYHYWYPDWPDHRSPRDINTLVDICLHVLNLGKCEAEFEIYNEHMANTPPTHLEAQQVDLYQQDLFNIVQPLPVIHCSAGIGRTGCLTAILNGLRQLRQSLAYSLTSMAAAAAKKTATGEKVLSPVDFSLATHFLVKAIEGSILDALEVTNDTDSSFTRNTLLYIEYISKKNKAILNEASGRSIELTADPDKTQPLKETLELLVHDLNWQPPSLAELPKIPDIFVDILGIVCNLRLQRGGMVQNSEQYELIHRALCLYLKRCFALKRF